VTQHFMMDLETYDTAPSSIILSIGIVHFDIDSGETLGTYYRVLDRDEQENLGRTKSDRTYAWWEDQSDEARAAIFDVPDSELWELKPLLWDVRDFIKGAKGDEGCHIWAKGPSFDVSVMDHAFNQMGVPMPWHFRGARCVRTICDLAPKYEGPDIGPAHNAVDDCLYQIQEVVHAKQNLGVE